MMLTAKMMPWAQDCDEIYDKSNASNLDVGNGHNQSQHTKEGGWFSVQTKMNCLIVT